MSVFW